MAILVRASFQMREFEDRFVTLGLNYRVIGGPRFYERQEIRDALAYLRVVAQPADDLAFERIVNTPKRGLGDATVAPDPRPARAPAASRCWRRRAKLAETEELKPKPRAALREVCRRFRPLARLLDTMPHTELAETILEESGYTEMWQADRSAEAPGRLENLKELIRSMEEFEGLAGFLEHVALVMDADNNAALDAVSHHDAALAPRGWNSTPSSCPAGRKACFPHQRALDESGRAGLEEERRLAYVGITRARERAATSGSPPTAASTACGSRPSPRASSTNCRPPHVEVTETGSSYGGYGSACAGGAYGASRFDTSDPFKSTYATPGWQRAQSPQAPDAAKQQLGHPLRRRRPKARTIEGELVASSVARARHRPSTPATASSTSSSATATSPPSTATSSPSTSTRPGRSGCWTALWRGRGNSLDRGECPNFGEGALRTGVIPVAMQTGIQCPSPSNGG